MSRKVPPVPTQEERKPYPGSTANFVKQIFFWWLSPVMKTGYQRTLQPDDLFYLTDDIKVQKMADDFYRYMTQDIDLLDKSILLKSVPSEMKHQKRPLSIQKKI